MTFKTHVLFSSLTATLLLSSASFAQEATRDVIKVPLPSSESSQSSLRQRISIGQDGNVKIKIGDPEVLNASRKADIAPAPQRKAQTARPKPPSQKQSSIASLAPSTSIKPQIRQADINETLSTKSRPVLSGLALTPIDMDRSDDAVIIISDLAELLEYNVDIDGVGASIPITVKSEGEPLLGLFLRTLNMVSDRFEIERDENRRILKMTYLGEPAKAEES